jgi:hypothetical protein
MINSLKTIPNLALEVATNNQNNTDLELIGFENLEACDPFKELVRSGDLTSSHTLREAIGFNNNFFYSLDCVSNGRIPCSQDGIISERGVGYLYEQDGCVFLKRSVPITNGLSNGRSLPSTGKPRTFKCCDEQSTVVISCVIPPTYLEALIIPNSVLSSGPYPFVPSPVQIQENSFLARLKDGIESLSFSSETFISTIISTICSFTRQIKLKTSKLGAKRIETDMIDIKPSNCSKAVKGSLCYDEQANKLKFYDGENWKIVTLSD